MIVIMIIIIGIIMNDFRIYGNHREGVEEGRATDKTMIN